MHKPWELPESLRVGQNLWPIRSDFVSALNCMEVLEADDLDEAEKAEFVCVIIYPDWEQIFEQGLFQEAVQAAFDFLDGGMPKKTADESAADPKGKVMSWTEDGAMIMNAINEHRPVDVRISKPHWWTFLGYYMEIGESLFSTVLSLRQKIRDNKKLDKHEKEFIQRNPQYFRKKEDAAFDDEEMDEIAKLFE